MNTEPEISTETPAYNTRRKGHVARLPKILRDKVNQMLADGVEYADIIAELQKSTNPPLPHPINADNIGNWKKGGYQDWLKERQEVEALHGFFELVTDMVANTEAEEIPDLTVKLLAARVCGVLTKLSPANLQENISDDPKALSRLLGLVPKLSREALRTRKYRRSVQREEAAAPGSAQAREKARAEFLDSMDQLFGIRPRKRPAPNQQNQSTNSDEVGRVAPRAPIQSMSE